ncbi:HAD family phosphatase [Candidatus Sumerlaeota bacterium]|nr:HAD family phosphatase [Candidatus Sumerlaeota bacterium]
MKPPKFSDLVRSLKTLEQVSANLETNEFTIVANPSYVYRPYDIYVMAPKVNTPRSRLTAIVKDMDGTTTTTEELCVHSLEFMVGRMANLDKQKGWKGLDHVKDLPHIIGNSTTRHVEYLMETYGDRIDLSSFRRSYFYAVLWTLQQGRDPGRREEVLSGISAFGLRETLRDDAVKRFLSQKEFEGSEAWKIVDSLNNRFSGTPRLDSFNDKVRAAIDVYYQRYHEILAAISQGKGGRLSKQILQNPDARLIEPMPGVAVFLAAVKGWLGEELGRFGDILCEELKQRPKTKVSSEEIQKGIALLPKLGEFLERHPLRVAVVTSSIEYEARIVLSEVFKILYRQAESWDISPDRKEKTLERFVDFNKTYDAFITATDSCEIRLKPHPDLYSLALHRMGVPREDFDAVIGFEDSESGVRAIRAAGVGLCVALPFPFTTGHDLSAAAYVLDGGLPEVLIKYSLFLDRHQLLGE